MAEALPTDVLHDSVAKHLRKDFVQFRGEQTVAQALDSILRKQPEGRIIYFYVTDAEGRLVGVVPTRRLLLSPRERLLCDIMVKQVIAIPHSATVLDACEFFILHKLLAFPVVDEERRIVGLVDVDLYTQELFDLDRREGNETLFQLIGVHLTEAQQASPFVSFARRFPWLLTNVAGGILAALLSSFFETDLKHAVSLAMFIPVVLALAESVSIQSVSLALQTLHSRQPTWRDLARRLWSELFTGVLLGCACGSLVALTAIGWIDRPRVAYCILGGIAGGVACATVLGLAIPTLLHIFRRNPQVAAGPIALAAADMITLLLYFSLARWLLTE